MEHEVWFLTKNICLLCLSLFFLPSIVSDLSSYISHHLFKESQEIDDIYEYVCVCRVVGCFCRWTVVLLLFSLLSCVHLLATPLTAAHQSFLSLTISQSLPQCMCIESVMLSSHLIFSFCLWSFPAIGSFPVSWLLAHQVAKVLVLQLQRQAFQLVFRVDFL